IQQARIHKINDIIIDPGFGFAKSLDQNYELMAKLELLHILKLPLFVGVSRKSMIYNLLETHPEKALNGTTSLNTIALGKGAHILRVHDVKQGVECVKIHKIITKNNTEVYATKVAKKIPPAIDGTSPSIFYLNLHRI